MRLSTGIQLASNTGNEKVFFDALVECQNPQSPNSLSQLFELRFNLFASGTTLPSAAVANAILSGSFWHKRNCSIALRNVSDNAIVLTFRQSFSPDSLRGCASLLAMHNMHIQYVEISLGFVYVDRNILLDMIDYSVGCFVLDKLSKLAPFTFHDPSFEALERYLELHDMLESAIAQVLGDEKDQRGSLMAAMVKEASGLPQNSAQPRWRRGEFLASQI